MIEDNLLSQRYFLAGENSMALVYAVASVALSIIAVFGGFMVSRAIEG